MKPKNGRRAHYLTIKLAAAVKLCMENRYSGDNAYIEWSATDAVCNVLEALFVHGLRESYYIKNSREKYPLPNFWPFISKFTHSNIRAQICNLNQIKTDIGKARAWLRLTLNDCLLENYVNSIIRELSIVRHYYHHYAYLFDTEEMEIMRSLVGSLSKLSFNAPINSSVLNSWTITPLKLAGYLHDEDTVARLEKSNGGESEPIDPDEYEDVPEAVSALEFEGLGDSMLVSSSDSYSDSVSESHFSQKTQSTFNNANPRDIVGEPLMGQKSKSALFSDGESILSTSSSALNVKNLDLTSTNDQFMQILEACTITKSDSDTIKDDSESKSRDVDRDDDETITEKVNDNQDTEKIDENQEKTLISESPSLESERNRPEDIVEDNDKSTDQSNKEEVDENDDKNPFKENEENHEEDRSDSDDFEANPPGNSLSGRRGWSTGALVGDDDECAFASGGEEFQSGSPAISAISTEDGTFTTTLFRVFNETLSKIRSSVDYTASFEGSNRKFSTASSNTANFGGENFQESSFEVSSSGFNDEANNTNKKFSTNSFRSESAAKSQRSKISSAQSIESEYVVVEKALPNIEPPEKLFRMSCLTQLPREIGLSEQEFKCYSCRRSIGLMFGPYRICEFDGRYYCAECHLNEENLIPARILMNWDFKLRKVSRASKAFLDYMSDQPLIHLNDINPSLIDVVEKMAEIRAMRSQLCFVAMYLLTCRDVIADDFRKRVYPKEYLYDDIDLYSITDLKNIQNGALQKQIKALLNYAVKHVIDACRLCASRGYVCEICNARQILYPFQFDTTNRCSKCYSVYHKICAEGQPCPKCVRREMYAKSTFDSGIELCPTTDL